MNERCEVCRFWYGPPDSAMAICRRHAPRPLVMWQDREWQGGDDGQVGYREFPVWPETLDTDWCGEFERKGE